MRTKPRTPLSIWTTPQSNREECQDRRRFKVEQMRRRFMQAGMSHMMSSLFSPPPEEHQPQTEMIQ